MLCLVGLVELLESRILKEYRYVRMTLPTYPSKNQKTKMSTRSTNFVLCSACQVAQLQYNEGKVSEAEKTCEQILESNPNHVESLLLLAAVHYACGLFER